ncbi:hypothetical protein ACIPPM_10155 [Streptomyces sp. NPDC090119]|uniref:hypothetical protein n=1 Tax=Streptomyces sp. NPDC090119 TaxID=3365951 RepID=UPI00382C2D1F
MQDQPMRYCLITPEGDLSFDTATLPEIRIRLGANMAGETGLEWLDSLYPVAAYYYVPFAQDTRRMNKAANGMFWELSAPVERADDDGEPEERDPADRVIKMRGPVAFINRYAWGVSEEQEAALRTSYTQVVTRLRDRGWL